MARRSLVLTHNLQPKRFQWLWAKYVVGVNTEKHCTNCLRGRYSKQFSGHNHALCNEAVEFNEATEWNAIYLCGVIKRGYPKSNYAHNLHAALIRAPGQSDAMTFEDWELNVENARFVAIPKLEDLPLPYRNQPDRFTSCRIFRWAAIHGTALTAPQSNAAPLQ